MTVGRFDYSAVADEIAEAQLEHDTRVLNAPATSWDAVDLGDLWDGDLDDDPPEYFVRTDGACLLYKGKVSDIHGEPEACKGWIACEIVREVLARGERVVYFDFEDTERGIVKRLRSLGVARSQRHLFTYVGPNEPLNAATALSLERTMRFKVQGDIGLAILDGVTQAVSNQGGRGSNDNDEIAKFFREVPRVLRDEHGAAVLLVDHVTKAADNTRYAIGGQTKLAAIDGASFFAEVRQPFSPATPGVVDVWVAKDRPSMVRAVGVGEIKNLKQRVTTVHLQNVEGQVTVTFDLPDDDDGPMISEEDKEATRQLQIGTYVIANPLVTTNQILAAVSGTKTAIVRSLKKMIMQGTVVTIDGPNRAVLHKHVTAE